MFPDPKAVCRSYTEVFGADAIGKVRPLGGLRDCGDYYNPKPTEQEVEDLLAWLNQNFYKFPQ